MPFKSEKQKKWMYANKPEIAKGWEAEEKAIGGLLHGPRHEEGGIPIVAEGGEIMINKTENNAAGQHEEDLLALNENPEAYEIIHKNELASGGGLIEKDSVNRSTLDMLEYINKHGDVPMSDARKRRNK